jgi:hypothetical protein
MPVFLSGWISVVAVPALDAVERHIEGPDTEERHQRHAAEPGAVHCEKPDVLAGRHVELHGLPHQRVVRPKPMTSWCDRPGDLLPEQQRGERLAIEAQDDLADLNVGPGGSLHGQRRTDVGC